MNCKSEEDDVLFSNLLTSDIPEVSPEEETYRPENEVIGDTYSLGSSKFLRRKFLPVNF